MSPRSPKRWLRPRSRRWFDAHGPQPENLLAEILKEKYQQGPEEYLRPAWSRLAYACGWMTSGAFWSLKPVRTGRKLPGLSALMYGESPFFRMVKKAGFNG